MPSRPKMSTSADIGPQRLASLPNVADQALVDHEHKVKHARRRHRAAVASSRLALLVAFLGVWQLYGSRSTYWSFVIGTPTRTLAALLDWITQPSFWRIDVLQTVEEAGLGYLIGIAIALALVAAVTVVPAGYQFLSAFLAALNALPKIVLAPLFILWFGLTINGKVAFVAASIFFVIFYGVHSGIKSINRGLIDNARMLGASRLRLLSTLYVPAVMTWLIVSLRISAAFALLAAVISEYLGSDAGIGYLIAAGRSALNVNQVLAGVIFLGALALCFDRVLLRLQRRFENWRVF
jgi:NitT/TauT family transport system permease protein